MFGDTLYSSDISILYGLWKTMPLEQERFEVWSCKYFVFYLKKKVLICPVAISNLVQKHKNSILCDFFYHFISNLSTLSPFCFQGVSDLRFYILCCHLSIRASQFWTFLKKLVLISCLHLLVMASSSFTWFKMPKFKYLFHIYNYPLPVIFFEC